MDYEDLGVGQMELANRRMRDFRGMSPDDAAAQQQIAGSAGQPYTRALGRRGIIGGTTSDPYAPDQPDRGIATPSAPTDGVTMIDPTTGTPFETTQGTPSLSPAMRQGFAHYGTFSPVSGQPDAEAKPAITVPQYASDAEERGPAVPIPSQGGEMGPPSPEFAGYAQGGPIGERRNYTAQDLAQMAGPPPAPGAMTTEDANRVYGALNRQSYANDRQNTATMQRNVMLASQANADDYRAGNAATAARVDAASLFGGKPGRAKAALSADEARNARGVANVSRAAVTASQDPNYIGQTAALNAQEIAGRREVVSEQQARQGLATGQQNQEIGAITLDQHKTQQRLLSKIETSKTAEDRHAAVDAYYASVQKEPPKPEPIVHGRGAEYTKPGELAPTKEADFFATRDSTGKVQIIRGGGETAPVPSPNHIAALKADPKKMSEHFDQIYGKGAAARILESK